MCKYETGRTFPFKLDRGIKWYCCVADGRKDDDYALMVECRLQARMIYLSPLKC